MGLLGLPDVLLEITITHECVISLEERSLFTLTDHVISEAIELENLLSNRANI